MTDANRQIDHETTQSNKDMVRNMSVQQRWELMWQMTIDEWAKKGIDITKLPIRKDVTRLTHLKDQ